MKHGRYLTGCVVLLSVLGSLSCTSRQSAQGVKAMPELAVGQVWGYKTRTGDEGSTLTIGKLETIPEVGAVVHISISGVHVKNLHVAGGYNTELPHAPFSQAALIQSLTTLVRQAEPPPEFETGYQEWQKARGGVFTVSVAEAVDFAEQALNQ